MPTYEYRCEACGYEFELMQAMSAKVKKKCPECKKFKLQKLISSGGFIIKGDGTPPVGPRPEHIRF